MPDVPVARPLTDRPAWTWEEALAEFTASSPTHWLGLNRTGHPPHTRPVLAVWSRGALCFACSPGSAKHRLLTAEPRVSLGFSTGSTDAVVEGSAERVTGHDAMARVAAAYADRYGWTPDPGPGELTGAGGAPTAGPPPYHVFSVAPAVVYTFPTSEDAGGATRFDF